MQLERHVPLDGASNFRDFGGYAAEDGRIVKWRRLFRSDRLSELTAADYEGLAAHGIRVVYDLRRESETEAAPTVWPGVAAPELFPTPIFTDVALGSTFDRVASNEAARNDPEVARGIMRKTYARMVTDPGPLAAFERIFTRLASEGGAPAVFHCTAGKDRTGVTCALILGALGVSREDIVEDFMLTARYYAAERSLINRISQVVAGMEPEAWSREAMMQIVGVHPSYIETALNLIEEDGGASAFLTRKAGVEPAALQRLRDELLG